MWNHGIRWRGNSLVVPTCRGPTRTNNFRSLICSSNILKILLAVSYSGCSKDTNQHGKLYIGSKLTATSLLCKSDQMASAGFFRDILTSKVETQAYIHSESKPSVWKIKLKANSAEVIRFSGAKETIEDVETYNVENTVSGLLLTSQRLEQGTSPQIITIDNSNSSFVYSSQHVNPLWNRANVFYGSCATY